MLIPITYFGGGIARDYAQGRTGECSICKNFDVLSLPNRLQPTRTVSVGTEPTDTEIGNIIMASNGEMYGVGTNPVDGTAGELYRRTAFGSGNVWADFSTDQLSGAAPNYDFLVYWPESGATTARNIFWASANLLVRSAEGSSAVTQALTFSTIGQGLVHPKDKKLYFPYQTSDAFKIGIFSSNTADFSGLGTPWTVLSSTRYRAYCLSNYGDYLAIPMTAASTGGGVHRSSVGLWDRDTSLTTFNETIPWGAGALKVLNNLSGALIGISEYLGDNTGTAHSSDIDKIEIKVFTGGSEPETVKELIVNKISTTSPSCILNPRVNFIHNNRLYFSANLVGGGEDHYGVYSVGRNLFGEWTVQLEYQTVGACLAAAMNGNFLSLVDTTVGSVRSSVYGTDIDGTTFSTQSIWDSCINPDMPVADKRKMKKLVGVYANYLPLPSAAEVIMQYRVDSTKSGAWTTIFTETTNSAVLTEKVKDSDGAQFKEGVSYEFRLISTGGAIITEWGYKYETLNSQL